MRKRIVLPMVLLLALVLCACGGKSYFSVDDVEMLLDAGAFGDSDMEELDDDILLMLPEAAQCPAGHVPHLLPRRRAPAGACVPPAAGQHRPAGGGGLGLHRGADEGLSTERDGVPDGSHWMFEDIHGSMAIWKEMQPCRDIASAGLYISEQIDPFQQEVDQIAVEDAVIIIEMMGNIHSDDDLLEEVAGQLQRFQLGGFFLLRAHLEG